MNRRCFRTYPASTSDKIKHSDRIEYVKELVGMKPTREAGVFDYYPRAGLS